MKHLDYLDTAKGICMLLIMLGHCATGTDARHDWFLITWIYSFHTTTFFIITGMLMAHVCEYERPIKRILLANIKRLLLPYFAFQCIYSIQYCFMHGFRHLLWLPLDIILLVDWDYATWFLLVLFFSKLIANLLCKICKTRIIKGICFISIFITSLTLIHINATTPFPWLYRLLLRSLMGTGFVYIGLVLYKYKQFFHKKYVVVISLCISIVSSYINGLVSTFYLSISNPVFYVVAALSGATFIITVSMYIRIAFLRFFGKESVVALGTHQLILYLLPIKNVSAWFIITPITSVMMDCVTLIRKYWLHIRPSRQ